MRTSVWPAMTSVIAGGMPLYGTCVIWMPAARISSSVAKWFVPPCPDEPKLSLPGCDFASAKNSARFFAGTVFDTVRSIGPFATIATGEKPAIGSNGRLGWIAAFVVNDDDKRQIV